MVAGKIASAGHLNGGGQVAEHGIQVRHALRDAIRERASDGVLQQHLVGLEAIAIDAHYLASVKVHRHNRHEYQYPNDEVENRYALWQRKFTHGSFSPRHTRAVDTNGGFYPNSCPGKPQSRFVRLPKYKHPASCESRLAG